uniref:hypothetical protein n=1 Tax=Candidatus Fimenecus sp. TaxID=3022888 RepID=UPI0040281C77
MTMETIALLIGLIASMSGILFAFLSFRRNERDDNRIAGKSEGTIVSDIAHIKSSVDRMEKNINNVDARYTGITERLARVEESVENIQKRLEEFHDKGGV